MSSRCVDDSRSAAYAPHTVPSVSFPPLVAFIIAACLSACSSDPPVTEDTGITFMPPDAAADAPDAEDSSPPVSTSAAGAPCASDDACPVEAPVCFLADGFRDKYCTQFCAESSDVCPDGSHCTPVAFMTDVCLADCDHRAPNPCRLGYGCGEGAPEASVCAPGCDVDEDCPSGLLCNPDDGGLAEGGK